MSVYIYQGGFRLVRKSGVGQAVLHQEQALRAAGIPLAPSLWAADVIHLNTVFPDTPLVALVARLAGKRVVCYGHSTMEDFRHSFRGSDLLSPLFKQWIRFCYGLGDAVFTPTEYSRSLLAGYGLKSPLFAVSNGVDTARFAPNPDRRANFRARYGLRDGEKTVISVGLPIERKGILDYIALARQMPSVRFFWFGSAPQRLIPRLVREAMAAAPQNLTFPGYIDQEALRDAYCGADAFAFLSQEETEGIVVLEALASGVPTLLRHIPVYQGWLEDGVQAEMAEDLDGFQRKLTQLLEAPSPEMIHNARVAAQERSLEMVGARLRSIYQKAGLLPATERGIPATLAVGTESETFPPAEDVRKDHRMEVFQ